MSSLGKFGQKSEFEFLKIDGKKLSKKSSKLKNLILSFLHL